MKLSVLRIVIATLLISVASCEDRDDPVHLRTLDAEEVWYTEATLKMEITSVSQPVYESGFVWSDTPAPTTSSANKQYLGSKTSPEVLSLKVTGLVVNTTYYFRSFIISESGVIYGNELSFTTLAPPSTVIPSEGFQARASAVAFQVGGKAYIGMGHGRNANNEIVIFKDFWEVDLVANTWTRKKDFPDAGQTGATAFVVDGRGYIVTIQDPVEWPCLSEVWQYDHINDEWSRKGEYPRGKVGWATAFTIGNKAYVGTGMDACKGGMIADFYEYDPKLNQWTEKAKYPGQPIDQAISFAIGGKGYIGLGNNGESRYTTQMWEYDPEQNSWTRQSDCPCSEMIGSVAFVASNKAYVGTGGDLGTKNVYQFDAATGQWTRADDFYGAARQSSVVFTFGDHVLIGTGGNGHEFFRDFVQYTPH
ncbi:MAG: Kelch repeat-containing protein [Bacteroidota bacterium]